MPKILLQLVLRPKARWRSVRALFRGPFKKLHLSGRFAAGRSRKDEEGWRRRRRTWKGRGEKGEKGKGKKRKENVPPPEIYLALAPSLSYDH